MAALPRPAPAEGDFEAFIAGYRAGHGNPAWELRFVSTLRCEGARWGGYDGPDYWSRAQFSADSWAKVVAHFQQNESVPNADSAYFTGLAVAFWSSQVDPGSTAGWPICFNRGY